jgi:biotin transporter BioY
MWLTAEIASSVNIRLYHDIPHFDLDGEYEEGGSTRAGFFAGLFSFGFGAWVAGLIYTRRLDCNLTHSDWFFVLALFGCLLAYVVIMHVLTVTLERQTRHLPDLLFNIVDVAILAACAYGGYRFWRRTRR